MLCIMNMESGAAMPQNVKEEIDMTKEEKVARAWEDESSLVREIRAQGGFRMIPSRHPKDAEELCKHSPDCVCCIDGRVAPRRNAVAVAGSGILIKDNKQAREALVDGLRTRKIREVYMHEDCGAVALYAKNKNIPLNEAKKEADEWAQELTSLLGGEERPKTLPVSKLFHSETCVYLVVAEKFSLIGTNSCFPAGFQVNANVVSPHNALAQVQVALDIAFGAHGFGARFNRECPFTVVTVTSPARTLRERGYVPALTEMISKRGGCAVLDSLLLSQ